MPMTNRPKCSDYVCLILLRFCSMRHQEIFFFDGIPVHLILTPTLLNYDTSDLKNSDPLGVKNTETLSV